MSYILDALRKAEKDRNLGRTPSLGDVTTPVTRAPGPGSSKRVVALIALVAGMLVMAVLLWPRSPAVAPSVVATAPAPTTAPVIPAEPPPPGDASAELDLSGGGPAASADPALDEEVAAESLDDLLDESDSAQTDPTDEVDEVDEVEEVRDTDEAVADEGIPVEPDTSPALPIASPSSVAAAPTMPAPSPVPPAELAPLPEAPAAVAVGDVVPLRDMPSDYRAAFPELRLDVHVYDDDPTRRWALVNGKKAVEGSTLAEGPTVSAITPDGIVFDFRGRAALFPLRR